MDNIKISVIAPVYGVEKYIDKFLESLQCQTFRDFEMILVDDGSKDNCPAILDAFAAGKDNCRVIHQNNAGVSAARNAGLDVARGEYVYIVDSDDWMEPDALETLYFEAKRTGADLVYGDWVQERPEGPKDVVIFPNEFYTENPKTIELLQCSANNNNNKVFYSCDEFPYVTHLGGAPWRCLMKRSIIEKDKLRFDSYVRGQGDDILFTLYLYENVKSVSYIHKMLYHWRLLENSYTHGYKANFIETINRTFERMEAYLKKCGKSEIHWKAYYLRIMLYLDQAMKQYFLNNINPQSEKQRYGEFLEFVHSHTVREAIQNAPVGLMEWKRLNRTILILRWGFCKVYWMTMKKKIGM